MASEFIAIGQIVGAHSMFGETRVYPLTDFPERFQETGTVMVGDGRVMMRIESVRPQKNILLVKFSGINDRAAAERLRGSYLYVYESETVPLPEGSYYTWKLRGLKVLTLEGDEVGTVTDVLTGAGNDLLVIDVEAKNPVYVPFVKEFVREIDLERSEIRIRPIPGLIE